jgi:AcrR family transcriptional regulator
MEAGLNRSPNRRGRPSGQRDPSRTRAAILAAATHEFTTKGLNGARVDTIAKRARVNKRMLYHYFHGKEGLYVAVLEAIYTDIRQAEIGLDLAHRDPLDGVRELVKFTWDYYIAHPEFLSLLGTENLHRSRYLRQSRHIRDLHTPLIDTIARLLERGEKQGVIRAGVDPIQLYCTIAALGFFYLSNRYTLSTIFGREMDSPENLAERGRHIIEVVLAYLRCEGAPDKPVPLIND